MKKALTSLLRKKLSMMFVPVANFAQATWFAFRISRQASIAPVQNQPMMRFMNQLFRKVPNELLLGLPRRSGSEGKLEAGRHTKHVGIDSHIGLIIDNRSNNIRRFSSHPGQLNQLLDSQRHLSTKLIDQHIRHPHQVLGFIIWIADTFNERKQGIETRLRHRFRIREFGKQSWGRQIHSLIGTLGRKNNSHQQLKGIIVQQFSFGIGSMLRKIPNHILIARFTGHAQR